MSSARILVVEDETIVARDLCQQLKEMGYSPFNPVFKGEEALAQAAALQPDLVLMDINLGMGMDGITAARLLHEQHGLPVIFLTAYASDEMIERAKSSEPFGYIIKPFDERMLRSEIEIALYRHKAEQRLRLQGAALEAAANEIIITDKAGRIVWANTSFTRCTGYSLEEALGRAPGELVKSGLHDASFYQELWKTILSGKPWRGQMINRRKDGSHYPEDVVITPIQSAQQGITHYIAVKQDLTERVALETQVQKAQRMEALGQLSAGTAHDFNNILAATLLYIGLLVEEPGLGDNARGLLRELEREVQRGSALTRQLLAFGRQEPGTLVEVDLGQLLSGIQRMLRRLLGEQVQIQVTCPEKSLWTKADAAMLEQVLVNLCINARDAMPRGGLVQISARLVDFSTAPAHPEARAGRFAEITVRDTGCGMPKEVLERIFEPFFTTKETGRGTGLGLAIVHRIIHQHQGWISVSSQPGEGTQFTLFLPACNPAADASKADAARAPRGRGETIWVLEDEINLRLIMENTLRSYGYEVSSYASISSLRSHLKKGMGVPQLLLADHVLPEFEDGASLARSLQLQWPELKVILCSGYDKLQSLSQSVLPRSWCLLPKPFTTAKLLQTVREQLDAPTSRHG